MKDNHDDDHESMMDQCALECMHAIEMKDKESFRQAFHALVSDILYKLGNSMEKEE